MADIKPVGTDTTSGQAKEVQGADALIVNNVSASPAEQLTLSVDNEELLTLNLGVNVLNFQMNTAPEIQISGGGTTPVFLTTGDQPATDTDGHQLFLWSAAGGPGTSTGGTVDILSGGSGDLGGNGGDITITTSGPQADGNAGNISITTGSASTDGNGGTIIITAGEGAGAGAGGDVELNAGNNGRLLVGGGDVEQGIAIGSGNNSPEVGSIQIQPKEGSQEGSVVVIAGCFANGGNSGGDVDISGGTGNSGVEAGEVTIRGGYIYLGTAAGDVNIDGGNAIAAEETPGDGGDVSITGGGAFAGTGGDVNIVSGLVASTGDAGNVNIAVGVTPSGDGGDVNISAGESQDGNGGNIVITGGQGTTDDGRIYMHVFTAGGGGTNARWIVEMQTADPHFGNSVVIHADGNSGILQGSSGAGLGEDGDDIVLRGGHGGAEGFGGDVWITGGTGGSGGEDLAGQVFIGTYLEPDGPYANGIGTRSIIIGAELNNEQTVEIYNFHTPSVDGNQANIGTGAGNVGGLILLRPGYQTFGEFTGTVISVGPTYYDPNNGEIIRVGASIFMDGDGVVNTINGGDATHPKDQILHTQNDNATTYNLASGLDLLQFPVVPGTVRIQILLNSALIVSSVTDNGAGVFPAGAVLPLGGTVNYTTGVITGVTAILQPLSQVTAYYVVADQDGEALTPRGGNGQGTGNGGPLHLYGGMGGATGDGADTDLYGGDGGSTSGDAGHLNIGGGWTTDGIGGNVLIEGGQSVGTDRQGSVVVIKTGIGTGTGDPGSITLQTSTIEAAGTTAQTSVDRMYVNGVRKTLTDNTPVNLFEVAITAGQMAGGYLTYNIRASDGTDFQARSGTTYFSGVNKAGTVTTSATAGTTDVSLSAGTLAQTWASTAGTNKFTISLNADSSLTTTTLDVMYTVHLDATQLITIL